MLNYQDYEKAVYDALMAKRETDRRFNFSVRQKASKGAEKDYFIGTENSKYFGTTFWYVNVGFPGSAGDLINVFFWYTPDADLGYFFEFNQTNSPHNDQNKWALELIKNLEPQIEKSVGLAKKSKPSQKIHSYKSKSGQASYSTVSEMMVDVFEDAEVLIPLVNKEIEKIKKDHPQFLAHQFTDEEFDEMQEKLKRRRGDVALSNVSSTPVKNVPITLIDSYKPPLNQILFGPPGTGKTYNTVNEALKIIGVETAGLTRKEIKAAFDAKAKEGQIVFTTFHQSMSYEDFIEGIKPIEPEKEEGQVIYRVEPGIFKKLCQDASTPNFSSFDESYQSLLKDLLEKETIRELQTPTGKQFGISANSKGNLSLHTGKDKTVQGTLTKENLQKQLSGEDKFVGWEGYFKGVINLLKKDYGFNPDTKKEEKNYVLIIDEINRGNVSQIFGELITLIEEDKRLGRDEALEVMLPYSKEKFGVPANLYIIGTMNTADRSVEALDTALRRRFCFTEMPPKYDLKELNYSFAGITGRDILETINRRIEKLLDRDHLIGHSYFLLKKDDESSLGEKLRDSFNRNIIPLLQEYFFGDYAKMGAVLGKGFVNVKNGNNKVSESIFAPFDDFEPSDYQDKPTFEIIHYPDVNSIVTVLIKDITEEFTFEKAIRILMNLPID